MMLTVSTCYGTREMLPTKRVPSPFNFHERWLKLALSRLYQIDHRLWWSIVTFFYEMFESTCFSHWDLDSLMKILIFSIASKKANEKIIWTQKREETFIHILSDLTGILNKRERNCKKNNGTSRRKCLVVNHDSWCTWTIDHVRSQLDLDMISVSYRSQLRQ